MASKELLNEFPLLALIEPSLWKDLLHHESLLSNPASTDQQRHQATQEIERITSRLRELHPFSRTQKTITLGVISYHMESGCIEIPARVNDLEAHQKDDQDEIEVILCTVRGRMHESLFVTEARPLHLEILLHLAGYSKSGNISKFQTQVVIPKKEPIPIEALVSAKHNDSLPSPMRWEFVGSPFDDIYQPDLTGDLIIGWHAHDSVLSSADEKIALNQTRLLANKHPALKPGRVVTIVLTPDSPKK